MILKYRDPLHQCRAFASRIDKCIGHRPPFRDHSRSTYWGNSEVLGDAVPYLLHHLEHIGQ
ncbi:hypothetical protein MLP_20930 [Microlunatus phosphovorus NM-1]|uniref:Uncharacterized protein n=1 Tax=Microlunatus phosphovorus (strain ATCC 700054 / DSM 10555 / JCM 9379 / NBRC 101784 / NCIMB 13414 / VKM Ac-1990 / NM-1) TaxID=1032480 RepID=F5XDT4_MICPN|nr:hypothetical protein MLP_20930 [Microlunatus phosphovorus NM-1]